MLQMQQDYQDWIEFCINQRATNGTEDLDSLYYRLVLAKVLLGHSHTWLAVLYCPEMQTYLLPRPLLASTHIALTPTVP